MQNRSGRCLCGEVRYQIKAEPVGSRICWCRDCQRISSNGTVNAVFPSNSIIVSGETAINVREADSGNTVSRRFCPQCGSHLFADSTGRPGLTVVRVGTLDEPDSIKPTANIWAGSSPKWACLDPALDRIEGQPTPPAKPPGTA